ncbi:hypothetical protein D3C81_1324440 [compost metagenome]
MAGDRLQDVSGILDVLGNRPDLVQRRSKRHEPVARYPAVGWLKTHHAAIRRGLANRTAGIGTEREEGFACSNRCCRTAAGTARNAAYIPRVTYGMEAGILVGAAHGELVHIQLADRDRFRFLQLRDDRSVINRIIVFQKLASARRQQPLGHHIVLHANGQSKQ